MINKSGDLLLELSLLIVVVQFVYRSKTQSVTVISSTEAEIIAVVSCAKIALYLQSILYEPGLACKKPTPIYEDIASTINIVNSSVPTGPFGDP